MTSSVGAFALACLGLAACGGPSRRAAEGPVAAPKLPPVSPEALAAYDAGMRAMRLGGPDARAKAKPRFEDAARLDGKLWEALHALGVVQWQRGDDDEAIEAFDRALAISPASQPTLLARAEAHRRAGHPERALDDYRAALSRAPEDAAVHVRLASLLREAGKTEAALDAAREALRYASAPAILVELGMIYLAQQRYELAELVLRKALSDDAELPMAYNAQALVSMARGNDQEAFERFDRASALDPGYRDARFNKAAVLMSAGNYAAALPELQAIVSQAPDDVSALVALGVAQRGAGKLAAAKSTWDRVVLGAPPRSRSRGDALFNLAVLAMDFGERDPQAARAALDRYVQEAPTGHHKRSDAEARLQELGR